MQHRWFGMRLWMLALCATSVTVACSDNAVERASRSGKLQFALWGTAASGIEYRLRHGTFAITGASTASVSTEDNLQTETISVVLSPGEYSILLSSGWQLEAATPDGDFASVEASLTSANPQSFTIFEKKTTSVIFRFRVGDDTIALGAGSVSISIEVVDSTASTGGAGGTATGGSGGQSTGGNESAGNAGEAGTTSSGGGASVACIDACTLANATAECSLGICVIQSCMSGFADCDGIANNGCEVEVQGSDPSNCGSCGRSCSGRCVVGFCSTDPYLADPDNCGALGNKCPPCQGCWGGECHLIGGVRDCNGDGICIDLMTDRNHCGGCGRICPTECSMAMCLCEGAICSLSKECCIWPDVCFAGTCFNHTTNNYDCGVEGRQCGPCENCINGVCTTDPSHLTTENCGCPGVRCEGCDSCIAGVCQLDPTFLSNPKNCGCAGNECPPSSECIDGTCRPNTGRPLLAKAISASENQDLTLPPIDSGYGAAHTCAVRLDGAVVCWGANFAGQLGTGNRIRGGASPVVVNGDLRAVSVATGAAHSCALTEDGGVECWGSTAYGQAGEEGTVPGPGYLANLTPVPIQVEERPQFLTAGGAQNCIIVDDGSLQCWGMLSWARSTIARTPAIITQNISGVSIGGVGGGEFQTATCYSHGSGDVACWGRNCSGVFGDTSITELDSSTPAVIDGISNATAVSVGRGGCHACALTRDGLVLCWGSNSKGQLGSGTDAVQPATLVQELSGVIAVSAGNTHTCAVRSDGTVWCWGDNQYGQLGGATLTQSSTPVIVDGLSGATAISAGANHTCAILGGGEVTCWGYNVNGELGNGTRGPSGPPTTVIE